MDKKGFTLTELIAVIAIIGIIMLITIPVINTMQKNNKEEEYMNYVALVEKALYTYADIEMPASTSTPHKVSIGMLVKKNYLKSFPELDGKENDIKFKIEKDSEKVILNGEEPIKITFSEKTCSKNSCS